MQLEKRTKTDTAIVVNSFCVFIRLLAMVRAGTAGPLAPSLSYWDADAVLATLLALVPALDHTSVAIFPVDASRNLFCYVLDEGDLDLRRPEDQQLVRGLLARVTAGLLLDGTTQAMLESLWRQYACPQYACQGPWFEGVFAELARRYVYNAESATAFDDAMGTLADRFQRPKPSFAMPDGIGKLPLDELDENTGRARDGACTRPPS